MRHREVRGTGDQVAVLRQVEGTHRHRLMAEWHETVGIGYPKDELATCYVSDKQLWPDLFSLKGQRVWLTLHGHRIIGVEREKPDGVVLRESE